MTLNTQDINKFKKRLQELRGILTEQVIEDSAGVMTPEESKGYSQHQADEATDDFDRTIAFGVTNQEFIILRQIDRALEKIEEGTYGKCDISGEEIPQKRLDAIPYANMTVKSQEKFEKRLI